MSNLEKYKNCFATSFLISKEEPGLELLEYQGTKEWDSVGHMALIANIENSFEVMFDMNDVIDFSSYAVGVQIMSKYGVEIS
jgi:acyl carrier protein